MRSSAELYPRAVVERAIAEDHLVTGGGNHRHPRPADAALHPSEHKSLAGVWRWRERYEQHGYDGLMDRRRGGKPSRKRARWP